MHSKKCELLLAVCYWIVIGCEEICRLDVLIEKPLYCFKYFYWESWG